MARRVPLHEADAAIRIIGEDGGVILTDFSSITDVETVNRDAAPFIAEIKAEVRSPVSVQAEQLSRNFLPSGGHSSDVSNVASITVSSARNSTLHAPLRA